MKCYHYLCALLCLVFCGSAPATQIRVASYNILYDLLTDPHDWSGRKPHVLQTIKDADADILGLNEVTLDPQYDDLRRMLPEYTFAGWNGEDTNRIHSDIFANVVAFRKDKFELIDQGFFYLSRDPGIIELSWDMPHLNSIRHTSWARLRVKGSGETFTVMATHLTITAANPSLARSMTASLNISRSWQIAAHEPVILLGDHNATPKHKNVYFPLAANFDDAYDFRSPDYDATERTSGQWSETGGGRIDFIFSRGFIPSDYKKIDTPYYNGKTPSDHALVCANLTFADAPLSSGRIYVSPSASGTADGSMQAPYPSVTEALNAAQRGDTIFVTTGVIEVNKAISIKKSVKIFGGYDNSFSSVAGKTVITSHGVSRGLDFATNTDCEIRNLSIENCGKPDGSNNGGGVRSQGARLVISDCVIRDNHATGSGGGVFMKAGELHVERTLFLNNSAIVNGGAIGTGIPNTIHWFNHSVNNSLFHGNEADNGAAVYVGGNMWCSIGNSSFLNNITTNGGAVALNSHYTNTLKAHTAIFNCTLAGNSCINPDAPASAIHVVSEDAAPVAIAHCTILANTSTNGRPAVKLEGGEHYVRHNIIALNGDLDISATPRSSRTVNYNVFTTRQTVDYYVSARDITWESPAVAASALASILHFSPSVTPSSLSDEMPVPAPAYVYGNEILPYNPEEFVGVPPVISVVNPACNGKSINCLPASVMSENTLQADGNFDYMLDSKFELDALSASRPLNGSATIGAVEYNPMNDVPLIPVDTDSLSSDSESSTNVLYYNLNGQSILSPAGPGLYIRCLPSSNHIIIHQR